MAIAFDAHSQGNTSGSQSSLTISHATASSSAIVMLVGVLDTHSADIVTGVTYNSIACTKLGSTLGSVGTFVTVWKLDSPSTGTNNVVITRSSSQAATLYGRVITFNGGNSRNSTINSEAEGASGGSISVTTTVDNSWCCLFADDSNGALAASTNSTLRGTVQGSRFGTFDNSSIAPITPAGSTSMAVTGNTGGGAGMFIVVIDGPASVTVSPAVISTVASVQAPSITAGAVVAPTVISVVGTIQAPTVTPANSRVTNKNKNSASTIVNKDKTQ